MTDAPDLGPLPEPQKTVCIADSKSELPWSYLWRPPGRDYYDADQMRAWGQRAYAAGVAAERERIRSALLGMDDAAGDRHNYYCHAAWVLFGDRAALASPTPPAEPDMRHPKIQALIGGKARREIELRLIDRLLDEGPECDMSALEMEYWHSTHDRLREALLAAAPPQAAEPPAESAAIDLTDEWPTTRYFVKQVMAKFGIGPHENIASALEKLNRSAQPPQPVQAQAAEPSPVDGQWMPIESAPTGRVHRPPLHAIVSWLQDSGECYVEEAWFDFERGQWWPANIDYGDAHGSPIYPTHWMPLPPAPAKEAP